MKKLVTSYTFSASGKTVISSDFTSLEKIQLITNVTTNTIIYNFAVAAKGGSLSGTTLTLIFNTTSMNDSDKLQIFVHDDSQAQPVSGTMTVDAGTNLNTSALALDATVTGGSQQAKITDGTNIGHILKSDGTAAGQNAQMASPSYLSVPFTTTTVQAVGTTDAGNYRWVSVHAVTQGTSSTINFQTSNDGATWVSQQPLSNTSNTGTTTLVLTSTGTANNIYSGALVGRYFRLNVTGISAGTTAGVIVFSTIPVPASAMSLQAYSYGNTFGSAVGTSAFYQAHLARTTNPTAATAGNLVGALSDKLGKQVVVGSIRDLKVNQTTTITSSTAETTVLTAVASTFLDVYSVIIANTSGTATSVAFKDATAGTTRFTVYVPAGATRDILLPESAAFAQTTVNNNWTATSSASVTSLFITLLAVKNI